VRRVVVTEAVHEDALALLRDAGWRILPPSAGGELPQAEALLIRIRTLTEAEAARFPLIAKHGVGVDNIPLRAVQRAGGAVMNTPGANSGAVAEQALMMMLALARNLDLQRAASAQGGPPPRVAGLEARRLLVVGYGASGGRLAHLARELGMTVTVYTPRPDPARARGFGVATRLDTALAEADVISLHCPLTAQTRHLLDARHLALLAKGAFVVNCARGGLVDEAALAAALQAGHLGGAALDVTEVEPLPPDHPLRQTPNLILTPHAAAMSEGAFRRMGMMAAQNILDHAAGHPDPAHLVRLPT